MLNWCKNIHPDKKSQIDIPLYPAMQPNSTQVSLHPSRNAKMRDGTIRKIKPHPRKNSCKITTQTLKFDKSIQVCVEPQTIKMVDSGTQTPKQMTETTQTTFMLGSLLPERQFSMQKVWDRSSYISGDFLKQSQQQMSARSPRPSDLKIDNNFQTKATHCMVETKHGADLSGKSHLWGVVGVQSYRYQPIDPKIQSEAELQVEIQPASPVPHKRLTFQHSQVDPHSPIYHSKILQEPRSSNALSYASKYKQIYRNIETQFKRSRQKSQKPRRSQRKIKISDRERDRRVLFERQTIISYNDDHKIQSGELLIEESIIVERQSRSCFTAISEPLFFEYYSSYTAIENSVGLVLSIKEIPIDKMDKISQELLVYKQLEDLEDRSEGVLNLYQSQIDHDSESYLLFREPFTHTLKSYVISNPQIQNLTQQLRVILERLQTLGFYLRQRVKMEDCVIVVSDLKVHNMSLFTLQRREAIMEVDEAVYEMRREMLYFLN